MRAMTLLLVLLGVACSSGPPSTNGAAPPGPAPAPAPPPKPAPPARPETSLGALESLRADQVDLEVLCVGGSAIKATPGAEVFQAAADVCAATDKARPGHDFVVLSFDGEAKRTLEKEFGKFVATMGQGFLARVDEDSWLTDAEGKKYGVAYAKSVKAPRQVAFEVPEAATGLVFHDGKDHSYPITPGGRK